LLVALDLKEEGYIQNWIDPQNGQSYQQFRLPRDLTMTLVTGYSIPLRKKVIDRLDQLEKERTNPALALNDPAMLRHLLLENVEKVLALEAEVKELEPLAASYEFLTRTDGTLCVTDAAKALEVRPKDLFAWMQANKWIYRRAGNGHWVGYQQRIQAGLLDHRVEEVTRADGSTKITEQVRVTAKGMAKLGEGFAREMA
jgi:phage antirepressor YoqD-like protein